MTESTVVKHSTMWPIICRFQISPIFLKSYLHVQKWNTARLYPQALVIQEPFKIYYKGLGRLKTKQGKDFFVTLRQDHSFSL